MPAQAGISAGGTSVRILEFGDSCIRRNGIKERDSAFAGRAGRVDLKMRYYGMSLSLS
jgi:hypothetical protein